MLSFKTLCSLDEPFIDGLCVPEQAKNTHALLCASVELLSDKSWTENRKRCR